MTKKMFLGKPQWLSSFTQQDATDLANLIEEQTSIALPDKETNNTFEYSGDIHKTIYTCQLTVKRFCKLFTQYQNSIVPF